MSASPASGLLILAVAAMPAGLSPVEAAPLLCAGITTFNAIRNAGAIAGNSWI